MPDGAPQKVPGYDDDFCAWTQHQAAVVRATPVTDNRFDRENVAEEIEDLGRSYRDAVRSQVRRIIEHFLKLQYSSAEAPHSSAEAPRFGWMASIAEARSAVADKISTTLKHEIEGELPRLYRDGRRQAELGLRQYGENAAAARLPVGCSYTFEQLCEDDWYPDLVKKP
jgi:uncharacterized protein DUF29